MTAALIRLAALALFAYVVIAVTRWLEFTAAERERADLFWLNVQAADFGEPSRQQVEPDYGPRLAYGDLPVTDDQPWLFADILFVDHDAEAARLRSELECDAAVVLWLDGGAA